MDDSPWRKEPLMTETQINLTILEDALIQSGECTYGEIIRWRLAKNLYTKGDMADELRRLKSKVQTPGADKETRS